ncbi:MAG: hypothetical protein V3U54_12850 [Thermodesulfobacteriota bacterium]
MTKISPGSLVRIKAEYHSERRYAKLKDHVFEVQTIQNDPEVPKIRVQNKTNLRLAPQWVEKKYYEVIPAEEAPPAPVAEEG